MPQRCAVRAAGRAVQRVWHVALLRGEEICSAGAFVLTGNRRNARARLAAHDGHAGVEFLGLRADDGVDSVLGRVYAWCVGRHGRLHATFFFAPGLRPRSGDRLSMVSLLSS